jgi:transcription initiation factor TFIID TATA-box-binding protein
MSRDSETEFDPEINIANIVASGRLSLELDLPAVAEDLRKLDTVENVEHSRGHGNRLLIHFIDGDALGMLVSSGVYMITGAGTYKEANKIKEQLFTALASLGIISGTDVNQAEVVDEYQVQNVVYTTDLSDYADLNLNALAIGLGLEVTEYEPEQFPGLIYRPSSNSCTILIFASGKAVITGVKEKETAKMEISKLQRELESF